MGLVILEGFSYWRFRLVWKKFFLRGGLFERTREYLGEDGISVGRDRVIGYMEVVRIYSGCFSDLVEFEGRVGVISIGERF